MRLLVKGYLFPMLTTMVKRGKLFFFTKFYIIKLYVRVHRNKFKLGSKKRHNHGVLNTFSIRSQYIWRFFIQTRQKRTGKTYTKILKQILEIFYEVASYACAEKITMKKPSLIYTQSERYIALLTSFNLDICILKIQQIRKLFCT